MFPIVNARNTTKNLKYSEFFIYFVVQIFSYIVLVTIKQVYISFWNGAPIKSLPALRLIVYVSQVAFYKRINKVFDLHRLAMPKAPSETILRKDLRARLANAHKLKMCNHTCNSYLSLLKTKETKLTGKKFALFSLYSLNK